MRRGAAAVRWLHLLVPRSARNYSGEVLGVCVNLRIFAVPRYAVQVSEVLCPIRGNQPAVLMHVANKIEVHSAVV